LFESYCVASFVIVSVVVLVGGVVGLGEPSPFEGKVKSTVSAKIFVTWALQDLSLSSVSGLGQDIVDFGGSKWPTPSAKPIGKAGWRSPHLFQWVLL
jgi:hypothetical protein